MDLNQQILERYKQAMKQRDEFTKNILNYIISQIKNKKIQLGKDPDDAEIIGVIKKEIKSREESLEYLKKGGKIEDIELEIKNIEFLKTYLPQMMDSKTLEDLIKRHISILGIVDVKAERGRLVASLMQDYKSVIDGKMMNDIITKMI